MKILLEELPHQEKALDAIMESFVGLDNNYNYIDRSYYYTNPVLLNSCQDDINIDVKMETGERVIIVTGCINVLVSRVSGTLTKYNSCIA